MNAFKTAKPVVAAPKAKKADTKPVVEIKGLEELAAIEAVIKSLSALKETLEADVKTGMKAVFVETGMKAGKRPENFKGQEGIALASCELRKRSSASVLSEKEEQLFAEHNIPTDTITTQVETFIINPAYINDGALLERVGNAIGKVKGVPEDFIQKQEAVTKTVTTDASLDALFTLKDANVVSTMLSMVGTLALKPTIADMKKALEIVDSLLDKKDTN